MGERAFLGDAEEVIAGRVAGLDLEEHPIPHRQLSTSRRKAIERKIERRTATKEEYELYMWDKRFSRRRRQGVKRFWKHERDALMRGDKGTRNWDEEQRSSIISGRPAQFDGKTLQAHHTFSAAKYPHLANLGEVIYPATPYEHLHAWHGGNWRKGKPGRRIRKFNEF